MNEPKTYTVDTAKLYKEMVPKTELLIEQNWDLLRGRIGDLSQIITEACVEAIEGQQH